MGVMAFLHPLQDEDCIDIEWCGESKMQWYDISPACKNLWRSQSRRDVEICMCRLAKMLSRQRVMSTT